MEGMMMAYGENTTNNYSNGNSGVASPTPLSMMMMPPPHHHHNHHRHNSSSMMMQFQETSPNPSHHLPQNLNSSNNVVEGCYFMENGNNNGGSSSSSISASSVKAKIMAHPHYHRLLAAYVSCQKVGAPPEVVARLEEACATMAGMGRVSMGCIGEDPGLDQFMEAYCEMLTKYEQELTKPFKEAMLFLSAIECQFKAITLTSSGHHSGLEVAAMERNGSSEEDADMNMNMNMNNSSVNPQAEDQDLKCQLLRKYSGYLGSLKQEFMKKRKKGKLPKEARQKLMEWWTRHYKWPYPSESQKIALAEATGLDQKQINNWFINQRKRHWKPSEEMQLVVMDAAHPPYYFGGDVFGSSFPMDISSAML